MYREQYGEYVYWCLDAIKANIAKQMQKISEFPTKRLEYFKQATSLLRSKAYNLS